MKFIIPLILVILTACASGVDKPAPPKDLISKDTMVMVMHDLVIIEGHIEGKFQNVQYYHRLARESGNLLLKKFNIDSSRFERSYVYYVSRQDELQGIYTQVLDSLNKEVNELKAKGITGSTSPGGETVLEPFRQ